jgi:hypothetical protein
MCNGLEPLRPGFRRIRLGNLQEREIRKIRKGPSRPGPNQTQDPKAPRKRKRKSDPEVPDVYLCVVITTILQPKA